VRITKKDWLLVVATGLALALVIAILAILLGEIAWKGAPRVTREFLTEAPTADMTGGGIFPAIYGTVLMTMLMTVAGVPVGLATAIWLSEYASKRSRVAPIVRSAIHNLAGVPSIVFGLFGLGFFVIFVGGAMDSVLYGELQRPIWAQPSILWASLTLAILTLPVVIVTTEEALRTVPRDLRDASLALGATKFQTIYTVVLPNAKGGILTGVILGVSRGMGEVAPIIFTGAANFLPDLPDDLRDMFMHLGYHVYALATQSPNVDAAQPVLFGTVFVLLALTFGLNLVAIVIRSRTRRALKPS
jgi:phosphate transport system permease protein